MKQFTIVEVLTKDRAAAESAVNARLALGHQLVAVTIHGIPEGGIYVSYTQFHFIEEREKADDTILVRVRAEEPTLGQIPATEVQPAPAVTGAAGLPLTGKKTTVEPKAKKKAPAVKKPAAKKKK